MEREEEDRDRSEEDCKGRRGKDWEEKGREGKSGKEEGDGRREEEYLRKRRMMGKKIGKRRGKKR